VNTATIFNRNLYDSFWETCGHFSRYNPGARHRRRKLGAIIGTLTFRSVLDVGCGNAENLLWLRSRYGAFDVTFSGVDLSPETVRHNAERYPFAHFETLNVEQASLDTQFDIVLCTEVIEHLQEQPRALAHLASMVSRGGHLVLTCPTGKIHQTERHFGHVVHPSPLRLRTMIEDAGLEVVSIESWGFPLYAVLKYATNLWPQWSIRNFASSNYGALAKMVCNALYVLQYANVADSRWGVQLFAVARKV